MPKKKPARKTKPERAQKRNKPKKPQPKKVAKIRKKPQAAAKPLRLVKSTKVEHPEKRPTPQELVFAPGDFVVYPTHGVGRVLVVEQRVIADHKLQLYVISFER